MPIGIRSVPSDDSKCPRCHRRSLVYLRSMRKYDARGWFKCDACDHIFTEPREDSRVVQFEPEPLRV